MHTIGLRVWPKVSKLLQNTVGCWKRRPQHDSSSSAAQLGFRHTGSSL